MEINTDYTNNHQIQSGLDRNTLITSHLHMVNFVVERMVTQVPGYLTREDMASAAKMGLINAADKFSPEHNVLFKTFAERRMRGAILDEARRLDFASRPLREKHKRLTRTISDLSNKLGREPEEIEIAKSLGLTMDEYHDLLTEVGHLGCVSIFEEVGGSDAGLALIDTFADEKTPDSQSLMENDELIELMAQNISKLTGREQQVIALYYYEELSQKEIADTLEITEGRVSQLHSQALAKLQVIMTNNND